MAVQEHEIASKAEIDRLLVDIYKYYEIIPRDNRLQKDEETQKELIANLLDAEKKLKQKQIVIDDLLDARYFLLNVEVELARSRVRIFSYMAATIVSYMFVAFILYLFFKGIAGDQTDAATLNAQLLFGIPQPVLIWAAIGSFTSMLIRTEHTIFEDRYEAFRWIFTRPLVGVTMGALTYLLVTTGLIVFVGSTETQAPQLIWVIAFIGGFSDTLSENLVQKLIGEFKMKEPTIDKKDSTPSTKTETESERVKNEIIEESA